MTSLKDDFVDEYTPILFVTGSSDESLTFRQKKEKSVKKYNEEMEKKAGLRARQMYEDIISASSLESKTQDINHKVENTCTEMSQHSNKSTRRKSTRNTVRQNEKPNELRNDYTSHDVPSSTRESNHREAAHGSSLISNDINAIQRNMSGNLQERSSKKHKTSTNSHENSDNASNNANSVCYNKFLSLHIKKEKIDDEPVVDGNNRWSKRIKLEPREDGILNVKTLSHKTFNACNSDCNNKNLDNVEFERCRNSKVPSSSRNETRDRKHLRSNTFKQRNNRIGTRDNTALNSNSKHCKTSTSVSTVKVKRERTEYSNSAGHSSGVWQYVNSAKVTSKQGKKHRTEAVGSTRSSEETLKSGRVPDIKHLRLLKSAQNGAVKKVQVHLDKDADINAQDQFGWTALMCACSGGHIDTVRLLLERGADVHICNYSDQSAKQITEENKLISEDERQQIVNLLQGKNESSVSNKNSHIDDNHMQRFYCETCRCSIIETESVNKAKHITSTLHLFNQKLQTKRYNASVLPESNRGFQIMLKSGWEADKGLGVESQGRKEPIKTILKLDRRGLGDESLKKQKARVTHCLNKEDETIQHSKYRGNGQDLKRKSESSKKGSKRKMSRLEKKQRHREINFRREFYGTD